MCACCGRQSERSREGARIPYRAAPCAAARGLLRPNSCRGRRARGDTARNREDADPHRDAQIARPIGSGRWRDERCTETRELITELALGIADGEERAPGARARRADCADCRRELERQSAIADGLLALAPEQEPPIGFELERAPRDPASRARGDPRSCARARGLLQRSTACSRDHGRRDAAQLPRRTPARRPLPRHAHAGERHLLRSSCRLADAAGHPGGVVFAYRGSPSWILITVTPPHRASIARAEIVDRSGRRIPLTSFRLVNGTWGGSLPVDYREVVAVHLREHRTDARRSSLSSERRSQSSSARDGCRPGYEQHQNIRIAPRSRSRGDPASSAPAEEEATPAPRIRRKTARKPPRPLKRPSQPRPGILAAESRRFRRHPCDPRVPLCERRRRA